MCSCEQWEGICGNKAPCSGRALLKFPLRKRGIKGDLSFFFCYISYVLKYNNKLQTLARELRKNMTDAESRLWSKLSRRQMGGLQFYRQRIIGDYIVDFYCPRSKLVIEIDGGQHYSGKHKANDKERDQNLNDLGVTVLRFSNIEVLKKLEGVLEHIYMNLKNAKT